MKVSNSKQLNLKLKGKKAKLFITAITKIAEEEKSIGFKKRILNEAELKLINRLSGKINDL